MTVGGRPIGQTGKNSFRGTLSPTYLRKVLEAEPLSPDFVCILSAKGEGLVPGFLYSF